MSKQIHGEDWAKLVKVISSVDTSSHKDDDMLWQGGPQVDGEQQQQQLALVPFHRADSFAVARSPSADSMMSVGTITGVARSPSAGSTMSVGTIKSAGESPRTDRTFPYMDASPPQVFSEFLTKQFRCRLMH